MTASSGAPRHDAYAALRHRDFRWYILSLFAMTLASQLQAVVVGWQVYAITHDPLSLGLLGLAEALPFIAIALPAGYVADRFNRRTITVCSQCAARRGIVEGNLREGVTIAGAAVFAEQVLGDGVQALVY